MAPTKAWLWAVHVKGYAGPDGSLVEEDEPFIDLGALFELIGRGAMRFFLLQELRRKQEKFAEAK
jgi:hypothetical protein